MLDPGLEAVVDEHAEVGRSFDAGEANDGAAVQQRYAAGGHIAVGGCVVLAGWARCVGRGLVDVIEHPDLHPCSPT